MKKFPSTLAIVLAAALSALPALADQAASAAPLVTDGAAAPANGQRVPLRTEKDQISYSIGVQTGRALHSANGVEVNLDALVQGLKDALEGSKPALPPRQLSELIAEFQNDLRTRMVASRAVAAKENQRQADAFLEANASKPGIVVLPSGVQYRILKSGTGGKAGESDVVTVNYRGTLIDGNEFDATPEGRPAHLTVASLIAGWKEVLKLMPIGSHWQVFIPPKLGYGERGVGMDLGPNELLVFDLELLGASKSSE